MSGHSHSVTEKTTGGVVVAEAAALVEAPKRFPVPWKFCLHIGSCH